MSIKKLKTSLANFVASKKYRSKQWYKDKVVEKQAKRIYEKAPPTLNEVQEKIVSDLNEKGISTVHISELFPDGEWWNKLQTFAKEFASSDDLRDYKDRLINNKSLEGTITENYTKKYLYRKYNIHRDVPVSFDDLFIQFGVDEIVLDIISAYLGRNSKLRMIDLWYNIALGKNNKPMYSQNWHRDGEDEQLVKLFLYFNDIDEDSGPFTYIPESHSKGKYGDLFPAENKFTKAFGGSYPSKENIDSKFTQDDIQVCTAKAGTLIFCDTNGIHRGGFCITNDRLLGNWVYTTPSSFCDNITGISKPSNTEELSEKVKFAVSFK